MLFGDIVAAGRCDVIRRGGIIVHACLILTLRSFVRYVSYRFAGYYGRSETRKTNRTKQTSTRTSMFLGLFCCQTSFLCPGQTVLPNVERLQVDLFTLSNTYNT